MSDTMRAAVYDVDPKTGLGQGLNTFRIVDQVPVPKIKPNEILVKNKYAGLNFIDTYHITGHYPIEPNQERCIPGYEAAGFVEEVGSEVKGFTKGQAVVYLNFHAMGEYTAVNSAMVVAIADSENSSEPKTDEEMRLAAAYMLQGLTALVLVDEAYPAQKGDWVYVPGISGGMGQFLTVLLKDKGVNIIGSASTTEKQDMAKKLGATVVTGYDYDTIKELVKEHTKGKGFNASYDPVGKDTVDITLDNLGYKGVFCTYGSASGNIDNFPVHKLSPQALSLKRPFLFTYLIHDGIKCWYSKLREHYDLFKFVQISEHKFNDISQLMSDFRNRKTTGKLIVKF